MKTLVFLLAAVVVSTSPIDLKRRLINKPHHEIFRRVRSPQNGKTLFHTSTKGGTHNSEPTIPPVRKGEYQCGNKVCRLRAGEIPRGCEGVSKRRPQLDKGLREEFHNYWSCAASIPASRNLHQIGPPSGLPASSSNVRVREPEDGANIMRESLRRLASDDSGEHRAMRSTRRVRVELMDGEHITLDIDRKARGADLLDTVCECIDVVEKDYFGLLHAQRGDPRVWVDLNRRLSKTFRNEPWDVRLAVKFYPPEPSELRDDVTRYQLSLAVRRDLMEGRLSCSTITHALLASYVLQAELGDCEEPVQPTALAEYRAAPLNVITDDLREKIDELYRRHKGQTPAEAELNYLENAKKLSLYGAELHCAFDSDDVDIVLAVCAHGISVYRDGMLMNRFPWAKILRMSYNKRAYTLRLRSSEFEEFETHLTFRLPSTRACKKLWRCSVEHHIFYRRESPVKVDRIVGFPRLGSRRLSCRRTLRQMRDHILPEVTA